MKTRPQLILLALMGMFVLGFFLTNLFRSDRADHYLVTGLRIKGMPPQTKGITFIPLKIKRLEPGNGWGTPHDCGNATPRAHVLKMVEPDSEAGEAFADIVGNPIDCSGLVGCLRGFCQGREDDCRYLDIFDIWTQIVTPDIIDWNKALPEGHLSPRGAESLKLGLEKVMQDEILLASELNEPFR